MKNNTNYLKIRILFIVFSFSYLGFSQSTATYDITFETSWNEVDHTSVPSNAHWSNLIGATHNTPNEFLELGEPATLGIKRVAELGENDAFINEIQTAINTGRANQLLQTPLSPFAALSTADLGTVVINENFPYLTLVSMVAPSPDWFIAINSLNMRTDNSNLMAGWRASFSLDVYAYDAGTDSGVDYTSSNNETTPVGAISMITTAPILGNKMGTLTVTLGNILSVEDQNRIANVKISPNPSQGLIRISNSEKTNINRIDVYNILGRLVKQVDIKNDDSNPQVNLSRFNKGIYLVKLHDNSGHTKTQKLILK